MRGERAVWEGQGQDRDRRRETLIGYKGARIDNQEGGGGQTRSESKTRGCTGKLENRRGRCWVVLVVGWNGEARVRYHYARKKADFREQTQNSLKLKGSDEAKGIRIAPLNIILGQAGGLDAGLRELQKGNVDVGVLHETKLAQRIHKCYGAGFAVSAT